MRAFVHAFVQEPGSNHLHVGSVDNQDEGQKHHGECSVEIDTDSSEWKLYATCYTENEAVVYCEAVCFTYTTELLA